MPALRSKLVWHLGGGLAERGVLRRRHAFDRKCVGSGASMLATVMLRVLQRLAQPLHLLLASQPQRIVGLDAQHEVDAALQVEPELQLLVHQPATAS